MASSSAPLKRKHEETDTPESKSAKKQKTTDLSTSLVQMFCFLATQEKTSYLRQLVAENQHELLNYVYQFEIKALEKNTKLKGYCLLLFTDKGSPLFLSIEKQQWECVDILMQWFLTASQHKDKKTHPFEQIALNVFYTIFKTDLPIAVIEEFVKRYKLQSHSTFYSLENAITTLDLKKPICVGKIKWLFRQKEFTKSVPPNFWELRLNQVEHSRWEDAHPPEHLVEVCEIFTSHPQLHHQFKTEKLKLFNLAVENKSDTGIIQFFIKQGAELNKTHLSIIASHGLVDDYKKLSSLLKPDDFKGDKLNPLNEVFPLATTHPGVYAITLFILENQKQFLKPQHLTDLIDYLTISNDDFTDQIFECYNSILAKMLEIIPLASLQAKYKSIVDSIYLTTQKKNQNLITKKCLIVFANNFLKPPFTSFHTYCLNRLIFSLSSTPWKFKSTYDLFDIVISFTAKAESDYSNCLSFLFRIVDTTLIDQDIVKLLNSFNDERLKKEVKVVSGSKYTVFEYIAEKMWQVRGSRSSRYA